MQEVKELQEKIVKELKKKYEGKAEVFPQQHLKKGDLMYYGIALSFYDMPLDMQPVFYINSYLEEYLKQEISLNDIIFSIYNKIEREKNRIIKFSKKVKNINKEFIIENVKPKLLNKERNKVFLKDLVYCDIPWTNEFVVAFECILYVEDEGQDSFIIRKNHAELLFLDTKTIYENSLKNSCKEHVIIDSENMVYAMKKNIMAKKYSFDNLENKNDSMYVLTNQNLLNGAEVVLDIKNLKKLENIIGSFYIVPSSIHEIIIFTMDGVDVDVLRENLISINSSHVEWDDVLGENIYLFSNGNISQV